MAVSAAIALPTIVSTTQAQAAEGVNWDVIAECESGNRNIPNATGSTASGYFQITNGTWRAHGGTKFAPRAIQATRAQQLQIAQRIFERRGSLADWEASSDCWEGRAFTRAPRHSSGTEAPRHALRTDEPPRHAASNVDTLPGDYTVRAGDTLSSIATAQGVQGGWQALFEKNRDVVEDPNVIFPSEQLKL